MGDHPLASLASLRRARLSSIHERFLISPFICSGAKIQAGLGGNSEKVIRSHRDLEPAGTQQKNVEMPANNKKLRILSCSRRLRLRRKPAALEGGEKRGRSHASQAPTPQRRDERLTGEVSCRAQTSHACRCSPVLYNEGLLLSNPIQQPFSPWFNQHY